MRFVLAHAALLVFAMTAAAQQENGERRPKRLEKIDGKDTWGLDWSLRGDLQYNDNVFKLDQDQRTRLEDDRPSDATSGRFDDMDSVEDLIFTPSMALKAKGPSPLGRRLELEANLQYDFYFQNNRRSHFALEAGVAQQIGSDGRLGLSLGFVPQYFSKNYLADATDFTDNVSSSERRYEAGEYREFEVMVDYRHQIVEGKEFTFDAVGLLGWRDRTFDSPFSGRDEAALSFGVEARFSAVKIVRWKIGYTWEDVSSPTETEVLILDETVFGVPLNGDGDALETDARSEQKVDRTHHADHVSLSLEVDVAEGFTLKLEWEHTWKDFASDERFDVSHRDRKDTRDVIAFTVKVDLAKDWDARLGYELTLQDTDRPADPGSGGETLDYRRNVFFLAVIFKW